jgi:hypothetical protein
MQTHHARGVVDAQGNLQIEAMPLPAGETVNVIVFPSKSNGATPNAPSEVNEAAANVTDPLAGI